MRMNRTSVVVGLAALGLAGGLAGGVALAATDDPGPRSPGQGYCGGQNQTMFGSQDPMRAAARYLGMTRTELLDQMHAGRSLAEIADAQGKTAAGLQRAMISAQVDTMMRGQMRGGMDQDDMHAENGMMGDSRSGMMGDSGNGMMGDDDFAMMGR
jgi:hypothetical protein